MNKFDKLTKHIPSVYRPTINKFIRGLLEAWGEGLDDIDAALLETKEQLFVETADGQYLDELGSNVDVERPALVGVGDASYRKLIAAMSYTPKQVKKVLWKLLEIFYSSEAVYANFDSAMAEPYALTDGDQIAFIANNTDVISVTFSASDFSDITQASAFEIVNAINKQAIGTNLTAELFFSGITGQYYVRVRTRTAGSTGSIQIAGGTAQNALQFPVFRVVEQGITTLWDVATVTGDTVRMEYAGLGPTPDLSSLRDGDLMVVSGPFGAANRGTFVVTDIAIGAAVDGVTPGHKYTGDYVEFANTSAISELVAQTGAFDVTFSNPYKFTISDVQLPATVYEINHKEIVVVLPSTAGIVIRRDLKGSAHLHPNIDNQVGLIKNAADLEFIQDEMLQGEDAMYLAVGAGDFEEGETVQGATSLQTAVVYKVLSNNVNNSILAVRSVSGGFIGGETITGLNSGATRKFTTLISTTGATTKISAILESGQRLALESLTGTFISGEALVGRTVLRTEQSDGAFEIGESVASLVAGHATLYLEPPWNDNFTVGDILVGTLSGASCTVQGVFINQINGEIILDVDTLVGTPFTAGEQITSGVKFGRFTDLVLRSGASADLDTLEYESSETTVGTLSNLSGVFTRGELVQGTTSGTLAILGLVQSSLGTFSSIDVTSDFVSPYVYDTQAAYTPSSLSSTTTQDVLKGLPITLLQCASLPAGWPSNGHFVLEFGGGEEEGPIPFTGKPTDTSLLVDPSYVFSIAHDSGASIRLVNGVGAPDIASDGSDYAAYITGLADARTLLQTLIREIAAAGIVIRFIIAFPEYKWSCYNTNE